MLGIVIVGHGGLATEYLATVEHVMGKQDGIVAIPILPEEDREAKAAEICAAADAVDTGTGVVVVVDMFGGSPSNLSMPACRAGNRRILYGANMPALIKLANLIPGGGIWMNTQRPEWNDANNALAGNGLSVVTAAYPFRYLNFLPGLLDRDGASEFLLTPALGELLEGMAGVLGDPAWQADEEPDSATRFKLVEQAGLIAQRYRERVYQDDPGAPAPTPAGTVHTLLENALGALSHTLRQNQRPDGLWHAYNVLSIGEGELSVRRLPQMLEGQVAILSSGMLDPDEACLLLESLPQSELWSERHQTYLLYPNRELPSFLEKNSLKEEDVRGIASLSQMVDEGDERIVVSDPEGGFRFHPDLTNHYALAEALAEVAKDGGPTDLVGSDQAAIEALYEDTFHHSSFTGRSGSMFGYEGLGCIYWHMVSKLMLAAQEAAVDALERDPDGKAASGLVKAYYEIQRGLGFRKPAEDYGAFPAEPYSHSPDHAGAQQPGLTGQVKEGILCRFGELGIDFHEGRLSFRPLLLREAEFAGLAAGPHHEELPEDTLSFTLAGTAINYRLQEDIDNAAATVHFSDGNSSEWPTGQLDVETTAKLTGRTGEISKVDVAIPARWLVA